MNVERWECPVHENQWAPMMMADESPRCGRRDCGREIVKVRYVPERHLEALRDFARSVATGAWNARQTKQEARDVLEAINGWEQPTALPSRETEQTK